MSPNYHQPISNEHEILDHPNLNLYSKGFGKIDYCNKTRLRYKLTCRSVKQGNYVTMPWEFSAPDYKRIDTEEFQKMLDNGGVAVNTERLTYMENLRGPLNLADHTYVIPRKRATIPAKGFVYNRFDTRAEDFMMAVQWIFDTGIVQHVTKKPIKV